MMERDYIKKRIAESVLAAVKKRGDLVASIACVGDRESFAACDVRLWSDEKMGWLICL